MAYSSAAIANRFLQIAEEQGEPVTPMKLQKFVYFAHGWHLALKNEPLCSEAVQAWEWGPVFPDLYHEIKRWGNGPVQSRVQVFDLDGPSFLNTPDIPESDTYVRGLCQRIWDVYGGMSAVALSVLTHQPGAPWGGAPRGQAIPNSRIKQYFVGLLQQNLATG